MNETLDFPEYGAKVHVTGPEVGVDNKPYVTLKINSQDFSRKDLGKLISRLTQFVLDLEELEKTLKKPTR